MLFHCFQRPNKQTIKREKKEEEYLCPYLAKIIEMKGALNSLSNLKKHAKLRSSDLATEGEASSFRSKKRRIWAGWLTKAQMSAKNNGFSLFIFGTKLHTLLVFIFTCRVPSRYAQ